MRPIRKGSSPRATDFADYTDAKKYLVERLGPYCSFCERRINCSLHVEHVRPKNSAWGLPQLEGRWENVLLACASCNGKKGSADMGTSEVLLPDRDNTAFVFRHSRDGEIGVVDGVTAETADQACMILVRTGLDRAARANTDGSIQKWKHRMEVWGQALESLQNITLQPENVALKKMSLEFAKATGHFSIWMTVFAGDADMRNCLIDAFPGTRESGCFDPVTAEPVSPAPNPDGLADGGKI